MLWFFLVMIRDRPPSSIHQQPRCLFSPPLHPSWLLHTIVGPACARSLTVPLRVCAAEHNFEPILHDDRLSFANRQPPATTPHQASNVLSTLILPASKHDIPVLLASCEIVGAPLWWVFPYMIAIGQVILNASLRPINRCWLPPSAK